MFFNPLSRLPIMVCAPQLTYFSLKLVLINFQYTICFMFQEKRDNKVYSDSYEKKQLMHAQMVKMHNM